MDVCASLEGLTSDDKHQAKNKALRSTDKVNELGQR